MTLGDLVEFEYWKAESADHDRVYAELEAMWDDLGGAASVRAHAPQWAEAFRRRQRTVLRWRPWVAQAAAVVLLLVTSMQYITTWQYDYHTGPGEIREVALADGSRMFLKGDTALDAQVGGTGARTIKLARGEAFFEVQHDAKRPFSVDVGIGMVRDIGTGFSVARTGQSASVSVDHGIVSVAAGGDTDILTKGQGISFNRYKLGRKNAVEIGTISAWRRGLYLAEDKPLAEVLADLDEYYPGKIVVTNRDLRASRINAVVQLDHIDAWLDALNETKGVAVRRMGPLTLVGDRPS